MAERKRVIFHVGPHKTGTTSVQRVLKGCKDIAYPPPERHGPGHADLAFKALGLNRHSLHPEILTHIVGTADAGTVVLSSEEFARAIQTDVDTRALQALTRDHDVELVLTLTPMRERMTAELQELIKQGQALNTTGAQALLPLFVQRPGLRPDFIARWLDLSAWQEIHVVRADKSRPTVIYEAFESILGNSLARPNTQKAADNARWPYVQTMLMSMLNTVAKDASVDLRRKAATDAYSKMRETVDQLSAATYPDLPGAIAHIADMIWYAQDAHIRHMVDSGRAKSYGKPGSGA